MIDWNNKILPTGKNLSILSARLGMSISNFKTLLRQQQYNMFLLKSNPDFIKMDVTDPPKSRVKPKHVVGVTPSSFGSRTKISRGMIDIPSIDEMDKKSSSQSLDEIIDFVLKTFDPLDRTRIGRTWNSSSRKATDSKAPEEFRGWNEIQIPKDFEVKWKVPQ